MDAETVITDPETVVEGNQGDSSEEIVGGQPEQVTESQQETGPQAYTEDEFVQIAESGKGLDILRLTAAQRASHVILERGVTKRLAEVNAQELTLREQAGRIGQMQEFTRQAMDKAMRSGPADEQIYYQYLQDPQKTTTEIEAASRELYMKSIDDTLPIEERREAADGHLTLNKTMTSLQSRFQNDQKMRGYTQQLTAIADKGVLEAIPDLVEKAPKLDSFISEQGLDMRLAAALTNPMVLENICRQAGINLNGAQAKVQVVKLINNLYDKTAGVMARTKTVAPSKNLTSRAATPVGVSDVGKDPFDPKLSTEERIELSLQRKQRA